jgi:acetyl-CoA synthetase (ADP-forming)
MSTDLHAILNPAAVAVIGASADPLKFGGRVIHYVVKHGFSGRIVPINASAKEVLGLPAHPSITAAPGPIDVAVLAVPTAAIATALDECGRAGVKGVVVIASDFAEVGDEGKARQDELVAIARRYGMRIIGPNCLGFINPHAKLALTSSVALAVEPMLRGDIGIVSQSGSLMASMVSNARDLGAGASIAVSLGNQADLEVCDFVEYLAQDTRTKAIAIYVEAFRDGARFVAAARRCRAAGKPLVVAKAGVSQAGGLVTRSHTASLAGSHAVLEAVCRDEGVVLVDDPERAVMAAHLLGRWGAPKGDGVAIMCPSGGTLAIATDRVANAGLRLASLSADTCARLARHMPPRRPFNTLDFGGLPTQTSFAVSMEALEWMRADPDVGMILLVVATSPQVNDKIRRWGEIAMAGDKPVVIVLTPGSLVDKGRAGLRELGCPFVNRMDDGIGVMRAALAHASFRAAQEPARRPERCADLRQAAARFGEKILTEHETKSLLAAAGVPVTRETEVARAEDAAAAAAALGFPVALKAAHRRLAHKSDAGAVKLRLHDQAAVRQAADEIRASVARHDAGLDVHAFLVQEMVAGELEMIVGVRRDPDFGPVVAVGLGGIYVELMGDVQMARAPVSPPQAMALLRGLKGWRLLDGARGRPRLDVAALADAIVRVSWIAAELGAGLIELEANPVIVRRAGAGVVAVDARATLA